MIGLALVIVSAVGAPADSVDLSLWAAHATQEGRSPKHFDPGLEPIESAVADLPFDTYRKAQVTRQPIPYKSETRLSIDARYTLFVTPRAKEQDGRIRLDIRVESAPKNPQAKPIIALSTRLMACPGKKTRLGGFKLDRGELVIVLAAGQE